MKKKLRNWVIEKIKMLLNLFGWINLSFANKDKKPPIFDNKISQGLKVHVGSGEVNIQGWVNIDARNFNHVHIISKKISFDEFTNDSIQEIYLCHVLEHLSFTEVEELLDIIFLKLKAGGLVRISIPDFDKIISIYDADKNNLNKIKHILMGGQDYEYNFHKAVFNKSFLSGLLASKGFIEITEWDTVEDFGVDLGDWSSGKIKTSKGKMDVSLNLKAKK